MKKLTVVMFIVLALIFSSTTLLFAANQGRNMQERMNIQTETAQYRANEDCTEEELQLREQRQEGRMLKQEAGENGRFNQRVEQTQRQRFAR